MALRLALPLASLVSACSFLTVQKAPPRPWAERPQCTATTPAVKRDFVAAAIAAGVGLAAIVAGAATGDEPDDAGFLGADNELGGLMLVGAVTLVGVAPAFGGSGFYGWRHTRACREALEAFDRGEGRSVRAQSLRR